MRGRRATGLANMRWLKQHAVALYLQHKTATRITKESLPERPTLPPRCKVVMMVPG